MPLVYHPSTLQIIVLASKLCCPAHDYLQLKGSHSIMLISVSALVGLYHCCVCFVELFPLNARIRTSSLLGPLKQLHILLIGLYLNGLYALKTEALSLYQDRA